MFSISRFDLNLLVTHVIWRLHLQNWWLQTFYVCWKFAIAEKRFLSWLYAASLVCPLNLWDPALLFWCIPHQILVKNFTLLFENWSILILLIWLIYFQADFLLLINLNCWCKFLLQTRSLGSLESRVVQPLNSGTLINLSGLLCWAIFYIFAILDYLSLLWL